MFASKSKSQFLSCFVILLLGYATGLQLGRIAPYASQLNDIFGFSLSTIGWLTSLVTLFVAALAIPMTTIISKFDLAYAIKIGAVTMASGAVLFAFSESLPLMIAARIIEAAGHVITVIAAPSYLALKAPENLKRIFLSLWSSFVPVGFAASSLLSGFLTKGSDLQTIWLVYTLVMLVVMAMTFLVPMESHSQKHRISTNDGPSHISWVLVISFGIYAFLSIGFFTFIPTYTGSSQTQIFSAGVVPLFVPLGSFTAAFLFAHADGVFPKKVIGIGFLTIAGAAIFCFPEGGIDGSGARAVYAFACGITAASIFTSVPVLTRTPKSTALTIGAIAQAGGLMVLLGAPLAGSILEVHDWQALGLTFALAAFSASALAIAVLWRTKA